jgi:hypothetical protein
MDYIIKSVGEPTSIKAGAIFVYENALPFWKEIIEGFEEQVSNDTSGLKFDLAQTTSGAWDGPRRNKILHITDYARKGNPYAIEIHNRIGSLLLDHVAAYAKYFETSFKIAEPYSLLKYEGATNDHYDAHYDGGPTSGRWISAIFYLNDDYEGGYIQFPDHNVAIKPKAGTLMIFPSNYAYRHVAHEVTSGTKYAIVTWIGGD